MLLFAEMVVQYIIKTRFKVYVYVALVIVNVCVKRDLFHWWINEYVYFIRRFATHEIHIY